MPPRTPNFAAHASLDVSQGSWLLPRRSFIHQSEPGAAAVERPPARPRNARDGGAGGGDDGFGLGQGGGRTGLGGHRDGGRPAPSCGVLLHRAPPAGRSVPTEPPPRWPVAVTGPLPMEALRPGCLGPAHASTELRPPGSGAAKAPRAAPPARGRLRGGRSTAVRGGWRDGRGRRAPRQARQGRGAGGVVYGRSRPRPQLTPPLPAWQMTLVAGAAAGAAAAAGRTMNAAQRLGWRRDGSAARRGEAAARSAPIRGDCTDQRRAARGACDRARARCAASRRRRQEDEQLAAVCGGAGCMHEQRVLVLRA